MAGKCALRIPTAVPPNMTRPPIPAYRIIGRGSQEPTRRVLRKWYDVDGLLQQFRVQKLSERSHLFFVHRPWTNGVLPVQHILVV